MRRAGHSLSIWLCVLAVLVPVGPARAQTPAVVVTVSPQTRRVVQPGEKVSLPLVVDLSAAGGNNLASLSATLGWGNKLTFDSLRASPFGTVEFNTTNAASGAASFGLYSATGATASFTAATLYMTVGAAASGSEAISLTPTNAGNESGVTLLSMVRGRRLDVCISIGGKWGDVNNDGNVNIIDAQQIARYSIGLSVASLSAVQGRGDANADAQINILDAQQVARFSIGLSAVARINTDVSPSPVVSALLAQPALSVAVSTTAVIAATPQDAGGASLAGCVPVTWQSLTPSVATVDSTGAVTGVSNGAAIIRATSGSQTADINVTVGPITAVTCASTGVTHAAQAYASPQTWTAASSPHLITGGQTFNLGSSLTIEAGALICLNGGQGMTFRAGSKLVARGTPAMPITFTATTGTNWGRIQFGDVGSYSGVSTDTSFVTNALVERGGSSGGVMLDSWPQHALVMDSVRLRASASGHAYLAGPGSLLTRSSVDTTTLGGGSTPLVWVGRGAIELTPVRNGLRGSGIQAVSTGAIIRNLTVSGGVQGLSTSGGSATDVRINNVVVSQPSGVGVDFTSGTLSPLSSNLEVTGGASSPWRGGIGPFGILFPDSASQEKLKVNAVDTLYMTGGILQGGSAVARPDLYWFVSSTLTIDTLAQLTIRPGVRMVFQNAAIFFSRGGTLNASGEAAKFIRLSPAGAGVNFWGLQFNNPGPGPNPALAPIATSNLSYVRLDSMSGTGAANTPFCCAGGVNASTKHRVLMDSVIVRKAINGAVWLAAPGSVISRSVIDTTGNVSSGYTTNVAALALNDSTFASSVLVRRSGQVGVFAIGLHARLQNVRIVGSVSVGLQAHLAQLSGDPGGVRADSANAYPFYGTIGNLALLAPDSATTAASFAPASGPGNVSNHLEIVNSTLAGTPGVHTPGAPLTLTVIPQAPWLVNSSIVIDTLARIAPRPGATLNFSNAGIQFTRGGTLLAIGEAAKFIRFQPVSAAVTFNGMTFHNPGPGPNPALAPVAVSQISFARLDSATNISSPTSPFCCGAALNAGTKHRLLLDSVIVRKAFNGAVWLAAPGSQILRSLIDTTGNASTGFTTTVSALALGDSTLANGVLVRRAGNNGVYASGLHARLQNVRAVGSLGSGLWAAGASLLGDAGSVRADSGNAWAYTGSVQNLAILAPDSATQANSFLPAAGPGNVSNRIEITNSTLAGTAGIHTPGAPLVLTAIPQLPWTLFSGITVDTLAQLAPRPGTTFNFSAGGMYFQRGGTLNAIGQAGRIIRFQPLNSGVQFYGFTFQNPGAGGVPALAPVAVSSMAFVQVDSAASNGTPTSPFCCQAAIHAGTRHRLLLDTVFVRKSYGGAIWISAPGSQILRSVVDTTGNAGTNYTSNVAAVALGDSTLVNGLFVRRSGQAGVYASGLHARLQNVRVVGSLGTGLWAGQSQLLGDAGGVRADSANGVPYTGTIGNFTLLAPDSATQANSFFGATGNTSNRIELLASTLQGTSGTHTPAAPLVATAIPQLPWLLYGTVTIDTLAQFAPRPGTTFNHNNAGYIFQRGGTLLANGEAGKMLHFKPNAGNVGFWGFTFHNPGPGPTPALAPTSQSQMSYARVDSADNNGNPSSPFCCQASINAGTKHRLLLDSVVVHKSFGGAIWVAAPGSVVSRTTVDTTGNVSSNYQTNHTAIALGDSTTASSVLVRRSGGLGVYSVGAGVRLQNVRIVASRLSGLQVQAGNLVGDLGGVRADSANGQPFLGTIGALAVLAPDSASQATSFLGTSGNVVNRLEVLGSTLVGTAGTHTPAAPLTVTVIPQLPWYVPGGIVIDTLARLAPRPGSTLSFSYAGLSFRAGGNLIANGEAGKIIRFQPAPGNAQFYGMVFHNPGEGPVPALAPVAESRLSFARLDSALNNGNPVSPFCCASAVSAGTKHRMIIDTVVFHKSWGGAVWLAAPQSQLLRSVVDTTGDVASGYATNVAAVALNDSVTATNLLVRRSGQAGIHINGAGISIAGARVVDSRGNGIEVVNDVVAASGGSNGLALSNFTVDSTQATGVGVNVVAGNVQLSSCKVRDGMNHGIATGGGFAGVQIANCNILNNGRNGTGLGVSNANTTNGANVITAVSNFWGLDLSLNPITPTVGGVNGVSANVTFTPVRTTPIP